jgi:hypothetical protein
MNLHNLIDTTGNDNQEQSVSNKLPWWQNKWVVIASLLFVYPIGLFITWKTPAFSRKSKVLLAIAFGCFFLIVQATKDDRSPNGPANNSTINSIGEIEIIKKRLSNPSLIANAKLDDNSITAKNWSKRELYDGRLAYNADTNIKTISYELIEDRDALVTLTVLSFLVKDDKMSILNSLLAIVIAVRSLGQSEKTAGKVIHHINENIAKRDKFEIEIDDLKYKYSISKDIGFCTFTIKPKNYER